MGMDGMSRSWEGWDCLGETQGGIYPEGQEKCLKDKRISSVHRKAQARKQNKVLAFIKIKNKSF